MAEKITTVKYRTKDGREFTDKESASDWESLTSEVDKWNSVRDYRHEILIGHREKVHLHSDDEGTEEIIVMYETGREFVS
jgi:hypothetical protein